MATMTPDALLAREQLRSLRERKRDLQNELATLQNAVVIARRQEIQDLIAAINTQIDIIKLRDPDDPPGPPAVAAGKGPAQ